MVSQVPNYDFECESCNYKEEKFVSITSPKVIKCPKCYKKTFIRCIGSGCGFIFKGHGFYTTDYKHNDDAIKDCQKTLKKEYDKRGPNPPEENGN